MAKRFISIRFSARLQRPATPKGAAWAFVRLPARASNRLPSRGMVSVDGTLADQAFSATLEPDGEGGHWFKVGKALRDKAHAAFGDEVAFELLPADREPEPAVPADVRKALAASAPAMATWNDITPRARRDWVHWITSGKQAATRVKRIATACDMLAKGKRRACCFDSSGRYSRGGMGAPEAAE